MSILEAIIIAIVEGLTEFLPVSSTGHMVITSSLLGIHANDFTKLLEVAIQLGAILAVVILYWKKFFPLNRWNFYLKLMVGVLPALLFGFLFHEQVDAMLESPTVVAITLLVGGVILLFIDNVFKTPTTELDEKITFKQSLIIGLWQVIAMIPGVSRSAASIIGGMQQKLTRNLAAEFSFFLAVPTMCAAAAHSLFIKDWETSGVTQRGYQLIMQSQENLYAFIVGNVVAFIVALLAIKFFISFLQKYGFRVFGIYRIVLGIVLLALIFTGNLG
jgi:undecaprenyl-diphosphatase